MNEPSALTVTLPPLVEVVGPEAVKPVPMQTPASGLQSFESRSPAPSATEIRTLPTAAYVSSIATGVEFADPGTSVMLGPMRSVKVTPVAASAPLLVIWTV